MVRAVIALLIVLGGFAYVGVRLVSVLGLRGRRRAVVWVPLGLMVACILWFPAGFVLPVDLAGTWLAPIRTWAIFLSMGVTVLLVVSLVVRDLAHGGLWLVRRLVRRLASAPASASAMGTPAGRRRFLGQLSGLGVLGATGVFGIAGFVGARRRAVVEQVEVAIGALPAALDGFRIVQITDLHVGHTIGRGYVQAVVDCVNGLDADLVAVTGDLTDGTVEQLRERVAPLAGLRARHGSFFVTGNHDYYFGDAVNWVGEADRLGMTPLMNEHRVIEHDGGSLVLAGVSDYRAGDFVAEHRTDPEASLRDAPDDIPRIMLAHQPRSIHLVARQGVDLQLSGHTHGGQLVPFQAVAALQQPVLAGLARIHDSWLYVSRGTGYWGPPFRVAAPSEITVVTLRRG